MKHCKGQNPDHSYTLDEEQCAAEAEVVWRDYLLGKRRSVGKFEQHLLLLDVIDKTTVPDLANNINRYLAGYIEMDIAGTSKTMMTYAKLGKFAVFGMIRKGRGPWERTRVNAQLGHFPPRKYVLPYRLIGFFNDRAENVRKAMEGMSPAQIAKVDAAVMANIDRAADSDQVRAMLADAKMFGVQAIVRKQ